MYISNNGAIANSTISTPALGVVFAAAYDADTGNFWIGYSSSGSGSPTWFNSTGGTTGNPATGANPMATISAQTLFPAVSGNNTTADKSAINFGQRPFALTVPTNFKALNTKNMTRPTDANMWFYGDTPDLMWIKNRTATSNHSLTDTVRGVGLGLTTNTTPTVENGDQDVAEMNKFGMTLIGASSRTTAASNNFVYWGWKGGGAAVTNTSGTITSQVSANVAAGFSVVTYTGDGSASKTVGHGLNAIPSMVIMRKRNVTSDWYVAHYSLNNSYNFAWHMFLNTTGANSSNNDPYFLSSGNTSSVIEVLNYSGSNGGNQSGTNYVAYCWTPIAGYSSFGSYTGNGLADGPFIYTGFRPRWILLKKTSATSNWSILDTSRDAYNVSAQDLLPNSSAAETTGGTTSGAYADILSNGFKCRGNGGDINDSGATYIYAAFAENPFRIARAR
jgi:hypothetical protein